MDSETQLERSPGQPQKPASELNVGDVLRVPGHELHDDLAGLSFSIEAERVTVRRDGKLEVVDAHTGDTLVYGPDEIVVLEHEA